jgi:hypothetical protein
LARLPFLCPNVEVICNRQRICVVDRGSDSTTWLLSGYAMRTESYVFQYYIN